MLWALVAAAALSTALASGCGEDGVSASCPDLPLYDVRSDAALAPGILGAREQAANAGCLTLPGTASANGDAGVTGNDARIP